MAEASELTRRVRHGVYCHEPNNAVVDTVIAAVYVHSKQIKSCRDGQFTYSHFSWAGLDLLSG